MKELIFKPKLSMCTVNIVKNDEKNGIVRRL